ncbi:MAG: TolC family protein [Bacteroidales bacterium]
MRKNYLLSLIITTTISLSAQQQLTLTDAIQYGIENNREIEQQILQNRNNKQQYKQSITNLFPSLSGETSISSSYGRSVDPETNAYTNMGYLSNSYGISSGITLFDGLITINSIKASKIGIELGGSQLQQIKDQKALEIMQLYFDALYYRQSARAVAEQLELSHKVLLLTQKECELGIKSEADVAQIHAQTANYDLLLTKAENSYLLTTLTLKEAINYPLAKEFKIVEPVTTSNALELDDLIIELNPEVITAEQQLQQSRIKLKIARGNYSPQITAWAGYNTNYFHNMDIDTAQTPFKTQLRDNYGYYFGATLSVPLFNRLYYRSNVVYSRNNMLIAESKLKQTRTRIERTMQQAILERNSSLKEQLSAQSKVAASEISYHAMERKFQQGVSSAIDLQTTANELLSAKIELLRASYNHQIQSRLVEYYSGTPLCK